MLHYAIALSVVITIAIIRYLPVSNNKLHASGKKKSLTKDKKEIQRTTTNNTKSEIRGTSKAIQEVLSTENAESGEDDLLDLDEWRGRRESIRCACDSLVMIGFFAAIVFILIQDYKYDLFGYLERMFPRETALVSNIISGVKQFIHDMNNLFVQDEL